MRDRQQPPNPGAALRAPVPAGDPETPSRDEQPPTLAGETAPSTPAVTRGAPERAGMISAQPLQGRRAGTTSATATAAAAEAATASSPIARRRAAAREAAQERDKQQAAAAEKVVPPAAAPGDEQRVIEPPVEIRQRRWGMVHAGQVIAAEVAVVGAVAVSRSSLSVLLPVAVASLVVLAVCFVRIDGRWLYEWLATAARYLTRRRVSTLDETLPGSAVVASVTHGGALRRLDVDGAGVAVLTDSTGFTAILEVVPDGAGDLSAERALPPLSELLPHNEPGDVPISVQLITHTVPAPNVAAADDAAANSYRELSGGQIPARRRTWICVQAMLSPEIMSQVTVEKALLNAVRRVERRMRESGFRSRLRNVRETVADLLMLVRVDAADLAVSPTLRESWRQWQAAEVTHVTYRVSKWPALAQRETAGALIAGIDSVPALARTSSLAGRRNGEYVDVEAVLRFTMPDETGLSAVDDGLRRVLVGSGADLQRMDGAHRFGVGATLPTGGFAV